MMCHFLKSKWRNFLASVCIGLLGFVPFSGEAQTVIGGLTPDPSAMLDVQSQSKGVLFPRMTTAERDAITNAPTGLMIFNTTENRIQINLGVSGSASWQSINHIGTIMGLDCVGAIRKGEMQPGITYNSLSGVTVIVPYTGGNGGAHSGQTVMSTGSTGFTATLSAGNFATGSGNLTYEITGSGATGTATFALNIGGISCDLDLEVKSCSAMIDASTTKTFLCYNLGAYNTRASSSAPSWEIVGNYYQWGTKPICFGLDGTDGTNPCSAPIYGAAGPWGNSSSNDNSGAISGWNTTVAVNDAWKDDEKTANDPCPDGFRVPTETQWIGVIANNSQSNEGGSTWTVNPTNYSTGKNFGSALFLPAAGSRGSSTGTSSNRGSSGRYWSSTRSGTSNAWYLLFNNVEAYMDFLNRRNGYSVRCVAE